MSPLRALRRHSPITAPEAPWIYTHAAGGARCSGRRATPGGPVSTCRAGAGGRRGRMGRPRPRLDRRRLNGTGGHCRRGPRPAALARARLASRCHPQVWCNGHRQFDGAALCLGLRREPGIVKYGEHRSVVREDLSGEARDPGRSCRIRQMLQEDRRESMVLVSVNRHCCRDFVATLEVIRVGRSDRSR